MLQKNGTRPFILRNQWFSCLLATREKVLIKASLMIIMTMMHNLMHYSTTYHIWPKEQGVTASQGETNHPMTLDTKIGKDLGFYCCPDWKWLEHMVTERILGLGDQSGDTETSTLAHLVFIVYPLYASVSLCWSTDQHTHSTQQILV